MHLKKADWNHAFIEEASQFPAGKNDDQIDAASGAYYELSKMNCVYNRISVDKFKIGGRL